MWKFEKTADRLDRPLFRMAKPPTRNFGVAGTGARRENIRIPLTHITEMPGVVFETAKLRRIV